MFIYHQLEDPVCDKPAYGQPSVGEISIYRRIKGTHTEHPAAFTTAYRAQY